MSQQIPPDYLQCTQEFLMSGAPHPFMVVTGHQWNTAISPDTMAATLKTVYTDRGFTPTSGFGSNWSLGRTRVLCNDGSAVLKIGESPTIITGTGAATANTISSGCVLIQKRTGSSGRKFRGRMYVPTYNIPEGNINPAGIIDNAQVTALQTMWSDFLTDLVTADAALVLLHSGVESPTIVASLAVQPMLATQRRRMRP